MEEIKELKKTLSLLNKDNQRRTAKLKLLRRASQGVGGEPGKNSLSLQRAGKRERHSLN